MVVSVDIPNKMYHAYTKALDAEIAKATTQLGAIIDSINWDVDYFRKKELRNLVIEQAYGLLNIYGDTSATIAAQTYNTLAALAGENLPDAILANVASKNAFATAIRIAASHTLFGLTPSIEQFRENAQAALKRYIKGVANDTIAQNAMRDKGKAYGMRWARVPRGRETCSWCMMLASRGFVYVSEQSADLYSHSHEHCDCDVIASFGNGEIEGYSFKEYQDFYYSNVTYDEWGHVDMDATSKNMRHSIYEENKDSINVKRREWYARNADKEKLRQEKIRGAKKEDKITLQV